MDLGHHPRDQGRVVRGQLAECKTDFCRRPVGRSRDSDENAANLGQRTPNSDLDTRAPLSGDHRVLRTDHHIAGADEAVLKDCDRAARVIDTWLALIFVGDVDTPG